MNNDLKGYGRSNKLFLPSVFIYQPILMKISRNVNLIKTQISHKM